MLLLFSQKSFILYVNMRAKELAFEGIRGSLVHNAQDCRPMFVHVHNAVYVFQKSAL